MTTTFPVVHMIGQGHYVVHLLRVPCIRSNIGVVPTGVYSVAAPVKETNTTLCEVDMVIDTLVFIY